MKWVFPGLRPPTLNHCRKSDEGHAQVNLTQLL